MPLLDSTLASRVSRASGFLRRPAKASSSTLRDYSDTIYKDSLIVASSSQ